MAFRQEVRINTMSPSAHKEILQLLLDELKLRIILKREWIGAVPVYELERSDEPTPIVKAEPHGRGQAGKKLP